MALERALRDNAQRIRHEPVRTRGPLESIPGTWCESSRSLSSVRGYGSGRDEFDLLVVVDRDLLLGDHGAQGGHRLLADVAASDEPFVVRLDGEHRDQADQAGVVGEDAD